jgi:hypothetical protein
MVMLTRPFVETTEVCFKDHLSQLWKIHQTIFKGKRSKPCEILTPDLEAEERGACRRSFR